MLLLSKSKNKKKMESDIYFLEKLIIKTNTSEDCQRHQSCHSVYQLDLLVSAAKVLKASCGTTCSEVALVGGCPSLAEGQPEA